MHQHVVQRVLIAGGGNGRRFGLVPLSQGRLYWFATINTPEGMAGKERGRKLLQPNSCSKGQDHPGYMDDLCLTER